MKKAAMYSKSSPSSSTHNHSNKSLFYRPSTSNRKVKTYIHTKLIFVDYLLFVISSSIHSFIKLLDMIMVWMIMRRM